MVIVVVTSQNNLITDNNHTVVHSNNTTLHTLSSLTRLESKICCRALMLACRRVSAKSTGLCIVSSVVPTCRFQACSSFEGFVAKYERACERVMFGLAHIQLRSTQRTTTRDDNHQSPIATNDERRTHAYHSIGGVNLFADLRHVKQQ